MHNETFHPRKGGFPYCNPAITRMTERWIESLERLATSGE